MQNQKKTKEVNLLAIIGLLLVLVIGAGLVLIPSVSNHNKAMAALKTGDLETAVKYLSKDYLFRGDMLEQAVIGLARQYLEEDRAEETMDLLVRHGLSRSDLYEKAFWVVAERYCAEGKMAEALERLETHKMTDTQLYIAAKARMAEELIKQESFKEARILLQGMGEQYRQLWLEASCAELKAEYQSGSARKFLDMINQRTLPGFATEDYQSEALGEMMLELAKEEVEAEGDDISSYTWESAIKIADAIPNRNITGLTEFYREYYFWDANWNLQSGDWIAALERFEACGEYEPARMCADVLRAVRDRKYLEIMTAVNRFYEKYPDLVEKASWKDTFRKTFAIDTDYASADIETLLAVNAQMCRFYETGCTTLQSAAKAFYKPDGYRSLYEMDRSYRVIPVAVGSVEEFAKLCGSAAAGKILILQKSRSFADEDLISYKINFDWMRHLPVRYRPSSLAEVEYLLVVSTDYDVRGTYSHGTKALREYGSVEMIQIPQSKTMYQSKTIYASEPPMTFMYYGSAPKYKSGGEPDLRDPVQQAFVAITN